MASTCAGGSRGARRLRAQVGAPLIATNDALMHAPERRALADVLACIREGDDARGRGAPDAGQRRAASQSPARNGAALRRGAAGDRGDDPLPRRPFLQPRRTVALLSGRAARRLCDAPRPRSKPSRKRAPARAIPRAFRSGRARRSTHELALIAALGYAPYFLTVHDIVRFARTRGILCQGRGSAANSAVCFCLGITEVDPARFDLLFERFISPERNEPPDIDVDFEHERREEVIQYIYQRYGRERAGLAAAVTTYRTRSAIRETAKVFGLSDDVIAALNGTAWGQESTPIGGGPRARDRARSRRSDARARAQDGGGAHRLSAPSHPAQRRLRHHPRPARRSRAGDERGDGGAHDGRMGQGRSRRARPAQDRRARARHADRAEQGPRSSRQALRRAPDAGDHSARGACRSMR